MHVSNKLWIKWGRVYVKDGMVEMPMPRLPWQDNQAISTYHKANFFGDKPENKAAVERSIKVFGKVVGAGRR